MAEHSTQTPATPQVPESGAPLLPLRDVVVYPHMVIPLFVGRERSIHALESAMENDKRIFLVAQRSAEVDDPGGDDLYAYGTVASILQMLKLPDGTVKVLVEGSERAQLVELADSGEYLSARVVVTPEPAHDPEDREIEVVARSATNLFEQYVKLNKKIPPEILSSLSGIEEPGRLADTIGVRIPDYPPILTLLSRSGPLAATSANLSGQPSALTADDLLEQLGDQLDEVFVVVSK